MTFSPENRTVYEITSKNWVETEGPQMTSQYEAHALHAGLARLHARMRNNNSRTRLSVTLYVHRASCLYFSPLFNWRWIHFKCKTIDDEI